MFILVYPIFITVLKELPIANMLPPHKIGLGFHNHLLQNIKQNKRLPRIPLPASQSPTPPQKIAMPNHRCNLPTAANARASPKPKPATWPKFCGDGTSQQTVGDKGTHLKVCVPVCPQILLFLCRIGDKVTKSDCPRLSLLSPSVPLYKFTVILPPKISSSPPDSWRWRRFHRSP